MKTSIPHQALLALALALFAAPGSRADLLLAAFAGDQIVRYDSTGGTFSLFASAGATMNGPTAMVYGADGNLYVLNEFSHNVLRFNGTTGAFIDEFISPATLGSAGVSDPDDMELGPDGNLYVSSHHPEFSSPFTAIFKFSGTAADTFLGDFATYGAPHHSHGLTFGPGGKLYFGDVDTGQVHQFDATTGADLGTYMTTGGFTAYGDLTFTPDGTLYATIDGGGGVKRYDGGPITSLIAAGGGQSYWGILADSGFLYVSNKDSGTLKKYTDAGVFVADITGGPGAFDIIPFVPEPGAGALLLGTLALAAGGRMRRRENGAA